MPAPGRMTLLPAEPRLAEFEEVSGRMIHPEQRLAVALARSSATGEILRVSPRSLCAGSAARSFLPIKSELHHICSLFIFFTLLKIRTKILCKEVQPLLRFGRRGSHRRHLAVVIWIRAGSLPGVLGESFCGGIHGDGSWGC